MRLLLVEADERERIRLLRLLEAAAPGITWQAAATIAGLDPADFDAVVLGASVYRDLVGAPGVTTAGDSWLERTQRLEGLATMAGGIARDLNNVLTPIQLGLDLLREAKIDEARRPLEEILQTKLDRATDLIRQLLLFARDPGEVARRVEARVSVQAALAEVERILVQGLPQVVSLEVRSSPDVAAVCGETAHVRQILLNLGWNARDAMPNGGRLTVSAANVTVGPEVERRHPDIRPGPYVLFTVADTGAGIPPEDLERIFDPFFTTKEPGKGTGLGLSAVLGLAKSIDGFVEVSSTVGHGSEFRVYLPAAEGPTPEAAPVPSLPRGRGELILVIDDEEQIRNLAQATLETFGYRVLTAADGAAGVALFTRHRGEVKAVLTDMMMPVMDGPATIRALQGIDPALPIIASSGLNSPQPADRAGLCPQAFLQKPYSAGQLLQMLRRVLDASGRLGLDHSASGSTSCPRPPG